MSDSSAVKTSTPTPAWAKAEESLKTQLQARLEELEPLLAERDDIQDKLAALDPTMAPATRRRRYTSSGSRRVARGEHDLRFLGIISEHGSNGMTVADVFHEYQQLGFEVQNPYLYKVASRLVERGNLRKDGDRYFVTETAKA